jgi:hypothetical protein
VTRSPTSTSDGTMWLPIYPVPQVMNIVVLTAYSSDLNQPIGRDAGFEWTETGPGWVSTWNKDPISGYWVSMIRKTEWI